MKPRPIKFYVHPKPYNDRWLNEIKKALSTPGFKIKPPAEPTSADDLTIDNCSRQGFRKLTSKEHINYDLFHSLLK